MKSGTSIFTGAKAMSSFSVDDLSKAKDFYATTLGLKVTEDTKMQTLMIHVSAATRILVYPKGPAHAPATYTVLNFPVDNVEGAVDDLASRGIRFERYEGFNQDEKGIARGNSTAIAWFKDPAGNILSVLQDK